MRLGIEWPRGDSRAKRSDRLRVASLSGERHSTVERRIGIVGPRIEHGSKRLFGFSELLALERLPSLRKGRVGRERTVPGT
jgi:hypothetical protein